jgi:hypothetical protein
MTSWSQAETKLGPVARLECPVVYGTEFASMGQPVPELVPVLVMRCPTDNRLVLDFFRFFWSAAQSTTGTRDVTFLPVP